jgi:hypothetical protein
MVCLAMKILAKAKGLGQVRISPGSPARCTVNLSLGHTCKVVLEGVHVAWRSALAFQSCDFVSSQVAGFILWYWFHYSKVIAK